MNANYYYIIYEQLFKRKKLSEVDDAGEKVNPGLQNKKCDWAKPGETTTQYVKFSMPKCTYLKI